jgi:NADH dehydrogenase
VDDLAELAVRQGEADENTVIDAIGLETFTYKGLVQEVGRIIGKRRPVISVSPSLGYFAGWLLGKLVGDVMLTREEIAGLMADLLCTDSPPAGTTRLTDWATRHAATLGRKYTSELARRRDRKREYRSN